MSKLGKYNIKAVSQLLGIQPGTLRAWERRYQMIAPVRNEAGHRLYTEEHVKILKWLVLKVNEGFTISQAIALMDSNTIEEPSNEQGDHIEELTYSLLNAATSFDESKCHALLDEAFRYYPTEKVLFDILSPLLRKIGDFWASGKMSSAQEHFLSALLRSRIGMVTQSYSSNSFLPRVMTVCSPNDRHELGLLMFTFYLKKKGFDCIYLGAAIDESEFEEVINGTNPRFLFFSCTLEENLKPTLALIERISEKAPNVIFGIGGQASVYLNKTYESYKIGQTQKEWDNWIINHLS